MIFTMNGKQVASSHKKNNLFNPREGGNFGVFETMRTYNGEIFKLDEHLERLEKSAEIVELELQCLISEIRKYILKTLELCDFDPVRIKVVVTDGNVLVKCEKLEIDENIYNGVSVATVPLERRNPEAKSLDYLESYTAHYEAEKSGSFDALLVNSKGMVTEGSFSNLFWVKDGGLFTTDRNILKGITRQTVLDISDCEFKEINVEELKKADEVFLTQTTREIIPVIRINGKEIGDGKVGEKTRELGRVFKWSRDRDSNPGPHPYHGCALPTELSRQDKNSI